MNGERGLTFARSQLRGIVSKLMLETKLSSSTVMDAVENIIDEIKSDKMRDLERF